jgi:xanthine dehydrogenase YagR molybdenum-binding subunit
VVECRLGLPQIAHCALEAHGQVTEWVGDELTVYASTQGVSTLPFQFAEPLGVPASSVRIRTDYIGGGFGAKFSPDRWGIEGARLAREAGKPVKLFLEREQEMTVAGSRPSAFARIRAGVDGDGNLLVWESESWGSGGVPGSGMPPIPYVFDFPHQRKRHVSVPTNLAGSRAWRAPNHPQACFLTMTVLEDLAAKLGVDPLDFFRRNLALTGERAGVYEQELEIAAEMIGWKEGWHPRGEAGRGPRKRGLGLSLHTWGGRGHRSNCEVTVHPDGVVEAKLGTQDLGTGTRTVVAIVLAETFGLPLDAVVVHIGDSKLPMSSPSGGSTTVGGVSAATRRAAQDALAEVFAKVAPELGAEPERLEATGGRIQVMGEPDRGLPWSEAAKRIGVSPITATGRNPGRGDLISSGVGGVQMADVTVDVETGLVSINTMVAVQDCGLIVDLETAESQVHGALIMGIGYALFEEWIPDPVTGRVLNPNMEFYRLAGFGDVGRLEVHMMTGPGFDERGVIGLGEPPVISPGAAISNAVANAIGVRVPYLPLTPDRVLAALSQGTEEVA